MNLSATPVGEAERRRVVKVTVPISYNPGQQLPAQGGEHSPAQDQGGMADSNAATAPGKTCDLCGATIEAGQQARRRVNGEWIHEACPIQ
jgi:hypothetical protein